MLPTLIKKYDKKSFHFLSSSGKGGGGGGMYCVLRTMIYHHTIHKQNPSKVVWGVRERGSTVYLCLFMLRFYGPVNPMGSCLVRSVYLTTRLLGRLSPLSG